MEEGTLIDYTILLHRLRCGGGREARGALEELICFEATYAEP
jgi:hypothetical protein